MMNIGLSDKLTIEINNSDMENRIDESDKSTAFDPDTLERNLDKRATFSKKMQKVIFFILILIETNTWSLIIKRCKCRAI